MNTKGISTELIEVPFFPYFYKWKNNSKRKSLYKKKLRILARGNMNSALVEFKDGHKEIISRNAIGNEHKEKSRYKKQRKTGVTRCGHCGKNIPLNSKKRYRLKKYKKIFCDKNCHRFYQIESSKDRWTKIKCSWCGKDKKILKHEFEHNKNKRFFCNRKCFNSYRYHHRRVSVKCDFCGKKNKVITSRARKTKFHFCNNKCLGKFLSKDPRSYVKYPKSKLDRKITIMCPICKTERRITRAASRQKKTPYCGECWSKHLFHASYLAELLDPKIVKEKLDDIKNLAENIRLLKKLKKAAKEAGKYEPRGNFY